jgi:hypothetical protein
VHPKRGRIVHKALPVEVQNINAYPSQNGISCGAIPFHVRPCSGMNFRITGGNQTKFQCPTDRPGKHITGVDVRRHKVWEFGVFHP